MAESQLEETIGELRRRRKDLRFDGLVKLMTEAGCVVTPTREGCLVRHPAVIGFMANVPRPHGKASGNVVKEPYVKSCVHLLELVKERQGDL